MLISDWKKKRELRTQIDEVESHYLDQFDITKEDEFALFSQAVDADTLDLRRRLNWLEEKSIRRAAERLAIEIPGEWLDTEREIFGSITRLSSTGKIKLRLMIRQERRENIEWWVKLLTPIITVLTGLLAALVALLAFLGHSLK